MCDNHLRQILQGWVGISIDCRYDPSEDLKFILILWEGAEERIAVLEFGLLVAHVRCKVAKVGGTVLLTILIFKGVYQMLFSSTLEILRSTQLEEGVLTVGISLCEDLCVLVRALQAGGHA